jgi:transcriptional regulator with XRE-family HTH domain
MITAQQSRMGRAALGWTVRGLAERAKVAVATVNRFETGGAVPIAATRGAMQAAMEAAGVRFMGDGCVCPPSPAGASEAPAPD